MGYRHLSIQEREVIMIELEKGASIRSIARRLGRDPSCISREIRKNDRGRGYRAHLAHERAVERRRKARRVRKTEYEPLRQYIDEKLRQYWSPEQIAGRIRREHTDKRMWVCHETIYRFIMQAAQEGVSYEKYLRQGHRRHTYGWRGKKRFKRIRDYRKIGERPASVEDRQEFGHWESDTLRGPRWQQAGIATHVERKTRFLVAVKLEDRKAETYNRRTIEAFARHPELPTLTFTVDNGMEFSRFKELEKALTTEVYFATPYHAWERGTNENTNGLLRQFFPKGYDLSKVDQTEIQDRADLVNNRPRKSLDYRTPVEARRDELLHLLIEFMCLEALLIKLPRIGKTYGKTSKHWKLFIKNFQGLEISGLKTSEDWKSL